MAAGFAATSGAHEGYRDGPSPFTFGLPAEISRLGSSVSLYDEEI